MKKFWVDAAATAGATGAGADFAASATAVVVVIERGAVDEEDDDSLRKRQKSALATKVLRLVLKRRAAIGP